MKWIILSLLGALAALGIAAGAPGGVQALITGAQIKSGAIESRHIKDGTISTADLARATRAALRGQVGPLGPAGPVGAQGSQGPQGATGLLGPAGPGGPMGPAGPQGAKGDPGTGVQLVGVVATVGDLPDEAEEGDAYLVTATGDVWVWDGADFVNAGPIRGPGGPEGPQGPIGPAGPAGPAGPQGPAGGLSGYEIVVAAVEVDPEDWVAVASATCPIGKVALGGGGSVDDPDGAFIIDTYPLSQGGSGWVARFEYWDVTTVRAYAICVDGA